MKLIQPNCRVQFTAEDIQFIVDTLARHNGPSLVQLLTEADTRDAVLDHELLFRALLEHRQCLRVSSHFYFYVLVRHVLRRTGVDDRNVADYLAEVLSEYSHVDRSRCLLPGRSEPLEYFFEMVAALQTADDRTGFSLRAHIGNYSLFFSGVFPGRIRQRVESRGFPGLKYYEALGRSNFRAASDHRLARHYELSSIFTTLSESFEPARRALNDLADRIFCLGDPDYGPFLSQRLS